MNEVQVELLDALVHLVIDGVVRGDLSGVLVSDLARGNAHLSADGAGEDFRLELYGHRHSEQLLYTSVPLPTGEIVCA